MQAYTNLGRMFAFMITVIIVIITIIVSKASCELVNILTEILYKPNIIPCKGTY
jgi:hypothetical protein